MAKGKDQLIRQLLADGITYMFGNPGTVEEGFLDVIKNYKEFQYITCLHESVAVAMADGYARKTKGPALVQLHSGVGLGNGIGMLYQAYRGHSPLIVIAGEAGLQYDSMDAQMACNLVDMAKPVTKYAARVIHKDSLLRQVRRAIKMAMTPPMGPVFLSLPMDILDQENNEEIIPSLHILDEVCPKTDQFISLAGALAAARHPVILAGDGVNESNATIELETLASLITADVYGVNTSCINISLKSPHYKGDLGHMFGENSKEKIKDADVILLIGTYAFPEVFPCLETPYPLGSRVFHIDLNRYEMGKNYPIEQGILANPKHALTCLNQLLNTMQISFKPERVNRREEISSKSEVSDRTPVLDCFLSWLSKYDNNNLIVFDEALTASGDVMQYLKKEEDGTFFQTRGGSLGVGIPGAMGISLADPSKKVIVFTGDGGSMYTIQALYTATRYQIPVKIVICKNNSYGLLIDNIKHYWKSQGIEEHEYPDCFDLFKQGYTIDYAMLAASMGVEAVTVNTIEQAEDAVKRLITASGAFLVELNTCKERNI